MVLHHLVSIISESPSLSALRFRDLELFYGLVRQLRPTIACSQPSYVKDPPLALPADVHEFISYAVGVSDDTMPRPVFQKQCFFETRVLSHIPVRRKIWNLFEAFLVGHRPHLSCKQWGKLKGSGILS